jgi:hypothetical protein
MRAIIYMLVLATSVASALGQLTGVSTRGHVGINQELLIGGFTLDRSATVVIRALGPSLQSIGLFDPLPDPMLAVYNGDNDLIAINDDWQESQIADSNGNFTVPDFGALTPANQYESALKLTLPAGKYTVIVSGYGNSTGIGLVTVDSVSSSAPEPTPAPAQPQVSLALYRPATGQTATWHVAVDNGALLSGEWGKTGPRLPRDWRLIDIINPDAYGNTTWVLFNPVTHQTAGWVLDGNAHYLGGAYGPTLPVGWDLVGGK